MIGLFRALALAGLVVIYMLAVPIGDVAAAESDFHYHVTFAVALAVGWSWAEARVIASANEAVDENEETVASLELTPLTKTPHQSPKSFRFHCFSKTNDRRASRRDDRNPDVKDNLNFLEGRAQEAIDRAKQNNAKADVTQALVAIGIYLHCQQDSWFHSGFGGQWDGHAWETLLAMISIGSDPDHPAARPAKTAKALDETREKLANFLAYWQDSKSEITALDLSLIKKFLTHPATKKMGSRERQRCHERLVGRWLHAHLSQKDQLSQVPAHNIGNDLSYGLSAACRRVYQQVFLSLSPEQWIEPPAWIIPILDLDGRPLGVRPDGTYEPHRRR